MNKIYKVIWSKAKHTYVVASEIAKGHTKGETTGRGLKKLAAALLVAAALMGPNFAWAADTTKVEPAPDGSATAVEVYTKEEANNAFATIENVSTLGHTVNTLSSELDTLSTLVNTLQSSTAKVDADGKVAKAVAADSAESATKAEQDGAGNVIISTYATKTEVSQKADASTVTDEASAREAGDKTLNDRITAVKEHVLKETGDNYVSKADAAVQDAGVVKADKKIGENVTALGKGLYDETAARIGADAAQDKVIKQVNDNLVASVNTINKNVADGFTALNQAGANEAAAREAKDNELNERITNEANAIHDEIKAGDKVLDDRITNVKEYLEKQTSDNYVSKADAAVQDGAVVKAANTIGENVTNLDAALAKETAARLGADKAQDKVIEQVNQNMVDGFNTINKNMSDGFTALSQADANELAGRMAADTKLVEATNGGLSLDNDNVLQKTKTKISSTGEVTTSKEAATTLILNKGAANQVKIDSEGVTVGTSSTQMDAEGFTAGGHDYDAAGAALMSDGRIKGANGDFTVDTDGNVASGNVTSTGTVKGKTLTDGAGASMSGGTVTGTTLTDGKATISNGNIKTNGGFIQTGGGNVNTQGGEVRTNGGKVATSGGEINTGSGAIKTVGGDILTAGGKLNTSGGNIVAGTGDISGHNITASGVLSGDSLTVANGMTGRSLKLTGGDLDAGAGTIKTTGEVDAGTLNVRGKATVKDLEVKGEFKAETLTSKLDENNYTTINGGNVTSVNSKVSVDDGRTYTSTSNLTEKGRTDTAADGTTTNVSVMTAGGSDSTISSLADKNQKSYITQNLKKILQGIQNGDNATTVDQAETGIKSTATDGKNTASTNLSNKGFNTYATDGTNRTYTLQTAESLTSQIGDDGKVKSVMKADGITNNADGGTITNSAKDLVNKATGDMTNTVGGKLLNDVTGDMENKVGGNLTTTVSGTSTETVTGKKTENYNGGLETTVTGDEKHAITGSQTNTIGGSQTTTVTGDSSLTAENINNTAKNKITNKALDVETEAKSSIVNKVSNDAGSNTSTQLSYETKEEMSANGKTASYLRGVAEEKSQLTDGAKKTTIDTVAGQTNTNITDGTNTSNNLQKADQAASSVTDGTNTTVVNQDAKSLASSITDGAKANNTSSTVDASVQRIQTDDTHYSVSSKSASKMEDALFNGSTVIDSLKDAEKGLVSTAVNDGTNLTGSSMTAKGITSSAAESIVNEIGDGSAVKSEMTANGITNTAKDGTITNDAKDLVNTASDSITDKVGENVERTMTTKKISESVKDGTKSNTFSKTAEKDISIITDGTTTSTLSQLANSVNTSFKNGTQSLNNTKTVTEDVTKVTDTTTGAFSSSSQKADSITSTVKDTEKGTISERSQTVSQVQDKVGTTTVTTTDGLTKLTNEAGKHNTQMDFAEVLKDLGVRGNAVVDGTLEVGGKSTFKDDVTMEKNLDVKGITTTDKLVVNNGATVTGGTTTDTLHVTSTSTFDGKATFKDIVTMEKDLSVGGNATVAGDVTANSYKVGDKTYIDKDGINANNQVIRNVGQGDISEGSTDAVSGGQLYETNTRVSGLETRMGTVETKVDKLDGKIDKVGANAAAMANLHPLEFDEDSKWNIAAAVGSSGSETASAVGVFYRPNENVMVNASAAMGTGENMFGGGVSLRLGHSGNKVKEAQMKAAAAENKELRAKVDDLTARMDALLSVLNPNMSKDFPDVPENHWAYEAVSRLAGNGIVEGYEDGKYHGERQMTRYEMAEIIYNALSKGAKAEKKLVEEFRPELQAMAAQKKA
ncbi:ESPR-type extended signal peptide-containing protein [uncultured Dialister sp.]|uniref:ESPR-type extended signal peptide-containing protein n=1 Tax=uncultured Dialister sp. TaxID=278064 RepID=UPI0026263A3A|nr:ESPR-type extended signal peptide-containing protein [uncultured Dialister sp.]